MSSATTWLQQAYRALPLASKNIFRAKLAVQVAFGCLFLVDSLYFVLCYVTFDFFGARNSPFFAWLRQLSFVMQTLYFPLLCAALLSISIGEKGERSKRLAFACVIAQVMVGAVLVLFQSRAGLFGLALLFGPSLQRILGFVEPYTQALMGLVPLIWISAIHVGTSFRSAASRTIPNTMRLSSFLGAGVSVSLLFLGAARMRLNGAD